MDVEDNNYLEELANLQSLFNEILNEKVAPLRSSGHIIFPKDEELLNAFSYIEKFEDIKAVIVGQDPYHGENQAHGFSFSVKEGVRIPPSLINIFKELKEDLKIDNTNGNLESWAKQGVVLLNRVLTVEKGKPRSHASLGWETYTNKLVKFIDKYYGHIIFVLWGSDAQQLEFLVKNPLNTVLKASHPSPMSCHRGFFGCKHFSKINELLEANGKTPIDWST